jgi:hypothetical protein
MAELLNVGLYSTEAPTLQRLNDFIKQQGYVTIGSHEEKYIKGPGMNGGGDPEKHLSIIRYRVKRPATRIIEPASLEKGYQTFNFEHPVIG